MSSVNISPVKPAFQQINSELEIWLFSFKRHQTIVSLSSLISEKKQNTLLTHQTSDLQGYVCMLIQMILNYWFFNKSANNLNLPIVSNRKFAEDMYFH